jgi:hypothetical protein
MIRGGTDSVHYRLPATERPGAEKPAPGNPPAAGTGNSRRGPPPSAGLGSLVSSLRLPPGGLSNSILSFAKFFSLPLEASFLGKIRQKALGDPPPPGEGKLRFPAGQFREALALAALASAAKGLELSPGALALYAGALLRGKIPEEGAESPRNQDSRAPDAGEGEAGDSGDPSSQAFGRAARDSGESPAGPGERAPGKSPASLRESALAAQGPLLRVLNRLPGREGKRWILLPFSLGGLDICLRVLLAPLCGEGRVPGLPGAYRAERMGLDLRRGEEAWRFILYPGRAPAEGGPAASGAPGLLKFFRIPAPGRGRIRAMERELAEFTGLPRAAVRWEDLPSFAESRDWTLPSLNKEV